MATRPELCTLLGILEMNKTHNLLWSQITSDGWLAVYIRLLKCVHTYAALRCKCMLLLNAACDELRCAALHLHVGVFTHTLQCTFVTCGAIFGEKRPQAKMQWPSFDYIDEINNNFHCFGYTPFRKWYSPLWGLVKRWKWRHTTEAGSLYLYYYDYLQQQ